MTRSALALAVLATGIAVSSAQAQPYPPPPYQPYPYGQQGYYPPARPLPPAAIPDEDDADIPPHQRAAPGNYPPPPGGYRGPFASEPPPVVYGRRPVGNGQPESYGAVPQAPQPYQAYPPQQQY